MKKILFLLFGLLFVSPVSAAIQGEEVLYQSGSTTFKGYLAYDDSSEEKRPGVIVVHEWWGHNDYARKRARMLAELGYVALAVDMYGDGKTAAHPDDAGKFAGEVFSNLSEATATFQAGVDLLKENPLTDSDKIAAIGYCFGGGTVLHMARFGLDLDAVVSFHGSLLTQSPAEPGKVKADVLVLTGADDPLIPQEHVDIFKKEMDDAGVNYKVISYKDTTHSFTNSQADEFGKKFNMPLAYNAESDKKSWAEMKRLLKQSFSN